MKEKLPYKQFGEMFKKLRLRAGIATLTGLGDLFASKGYDFEDSYLSHWQAGRKIPKRREILFALILLFKEKIDNLSIEDINTFLESANQGYLTKRELLALNLSERKFTRQFNTISLRQDNNQLKIYFVKANAYLKKDKDFKNVKEQTDFLNKEIDTIMSLLQKCFYSNLHVLVIKLWQCYGSYLWNKGRWNQYNYYGELAYSSAVKQHSYEAQAAICLQDLGWCYFWQADIPRAKRYIEEGLSIAEKHHLFEWKALGQQRLGKIYQAEKNYQSSLKLFQQSLSSFNQLQKKERAGDTLTYIGESYWLSGNNHLAHKYLSTALVKVTEVNDLPQKAIIYSNLGGFYLAQANYEKAKTYFLQSLNMAHTIKRNAGGFFWNNLGLGLLHQETNNKKQSETFLSQAHTEMHKLGINKNTYNTSVFFSGLQPLISKTSFHA